jgi:hypothetical protein
MSDSALSQSLLYLQMSHLCDYELNVFRSPDTFFMQHRIMLMPKVLA